MDFLTHLFVGRLLAATMGAQAEPLGWLVTLFAVLPDFDTVSWAFPRLRRYVQHRGLTHTLPFGLGASLVAALVFGLAGWSSFGAAFLVALAGWSSHVLLDVLNWGAPVLWPWRPARVEWTIHGGFVWSAAMSTAGVVALVALQEGAPGLHGVAAAAMGALFALYLGARAALKAWTLRRHPGRRALPTGNPLVWRLV